MRGSEDSSHAQFHSLTASMSSPTQMSSAQPHVGQKCVSTAVSMTLGCRTKRENVDASEGALREALHLAGVRSQTWEKGTILGSV